MPLPGAQKFGDTVDHFIKEISELAKRNDINIFL